jgi:hypothetical protein
MNKVSSANLKLEEFPNLKLDFHSHQCIKNVAALPHYDNSLPGLHL